jgi:hypothetical protein
VSTLRLPLTATSVDWPFIKGDSFTLHVPVLDSTNFAIDLTGWSGIAQIRHSSADPVLHEWSAAAQNLQASGTELLLTVDGTVTAEWSWERAAVSVVALESDGTPHVIAIGTAHAIDNPTVIA